MPVEINELVVEVSVTSNTASPGSRGTEGASQAGEGNMLSPAVLEQIIETMMETIKNKKER